MHLAAKMPSARVLVEVSGRQSNIFCATLGRFPTCHLPGSVKVLMSKELTVVLTSQSCLLHSNHLAAAEIGCVGLVLKEQKRHVSSQEVEE